MKRVADEFRSEDNGTLAIATTHTQARYVLPKVLQAFATELSQGARGAASGQPPSGRRTDRRRRRRRRHRDRVARRLPDLVTLPCYDWNRCVIVRRGDPLAQVKQLTLEALARHPIVTYDFAFTGRSQINAAFAAKGLEPNVVLTALDADVIKTYVELGMGVGHRCADGLRCRRDKEFALLDASHLFATSTTRLALRRNVFLRGYVYAFISLFAPQYDRRAVDAALAGEAANAT